MTMDNSPPQYFKHGDRVRVVDSCTAPHMLHKVGTVGRHEPKYRHRVTVRFYIDRDFRDIYFHPSEIELVEDESSEDRRKGSVTRNE